MNKILADMTEVTLPPNCGQGLLPLPTNFLWVFGLVILIYYAYVH